MKIILNDEAVDWFVDEFDLPRDKNHHIRFYVRYGGCGNVSAYSLGVQVTEPAEIGISTQIRNLIFYIEKSDLWYPEGKNLLVNFDKQIQEIVFSYA